jgi:hypothetical protein
MKNIIVGGLLAGLVLFVWSAIAHMPPLGTAGERMVASSKEPAVIEALRGSMTERAIYVIPGIDGSHATDAEKQAWSTRYQHGPSAIIAFNPRPTERAWAGSPFATWFLVEFLGDMAAGFLGALIAISLSGTIGFWPRALLMATIGAIATIDIDLSYWNWYGFPTAYLLAQFVDHVCGWFFAGLVLARVCRRT